MSVDMPERSRRSETRMQRRIRRDEEERIVGMCADILASHTTDKIDQARLGFELGMRNLYDVLGGSPEALAEWVNSNTEMFKLLVLAEMGRRINKER